MSYPPIVELVIRNKVEDTAALLDAGASPRASYPAAFFQAAAGRFERQPGEWPLAVFAGMHAAAGTLALLLDRGATVPSEHAEAVLVRTAGARPFDAAARAVAAILRASDVLAQPHVRGTVLAQAAGGESRPVVELLLDAGVPIDARDAEGRTVTHRVIGRYVMKESLALLEWLVQRGAPVDVPDANGELPLAHALRAGSFEAALTLLRAGSPAVGRLSPACTDRLASAVARARAIEARGGPITELFALTRLKEWDLLLEMGESGMRLDATPMAGRSPWSEILDGAPIDAQLRLLPLLDDRDLMLRVMAERAGREHGIARLSAALALGWDLNLPGRSESTDSTVLGAALGANAPVEALEMILAHGASVNGAPGRRTPAHDAARHLASLKWLAGKGADLDRAVETIGTPLQLAVEKGWDAGIPFLAKAGARLDVKDAKGRTPLERAQERGAKEKILDALTPRPARAARRSAAAKPVEVVRRDRSALGRACARGDADAVRRLVGEGADVQAQDARGSTPLAIAVAHGRTAVVEALLAVGAQADAPTADGMRPWGLAKLLKASEIEAMLAAAGARTVPLLLVETGSALERYGELIRRGDVRGLAAAVAAGMDVDLPLMGRRVPLEQAIDAGRDDVVDLLLRAGADPDTTNDHGETCLMRAAATGRVAIVSLLRAAGADVERLTPAGRNAAGIAHEAGHADVVALLAPSTPRTGHPDTTVAGEVGPPVLRDRPGRVAVLVNAGFHEQDADAPFWFDHDDCEDVQVQHGDVAAALRTVSYGETFARDAADAIARLGVEVTHLFVLFDQSPALASGPIPEAWRGVPGVRLGAGASYAGDFAYHRS